MVPKVFRYSCWQPCLASLNNELLVLLAVDVSDVGGLGIVVVQDLRVPVA